MTDNEPETRPLALALERAERALADVREALADEHEGRTREALARLLLAGSEAAEVVLTW